MVQRESLAGVKPILTWNLYPVSVEQSVKDDVEFFRSSPLVRRELAERTHGFVFDIKTGELKSVQV